MHQVDQRDRADHKRYLEYGWQVTMILEADVLCD